MKKIILFVSIFMLCGCSIFNSTNEAQPIQTNIIQNQTDVNLSDTLSISFYNKNGFCPHSMEEKIDREAMNFVYQPLYMFDSMLKATPILAESISSSNDGKTLTITTKGNVYWHDGSLFTATDAAYTINLVASNYSVFKNDNILGAKAISKNMLTVTLKYPVIYPESLFTFPVIKNNSNKYADIPNGTGAFCFINKRNSDTFTFELFDKFSGQKPKISHLKLIEIDQKEKEKQLFNVGETDALTVNSDDYMTYAPRPNSKILDYVTDDFYYLGFNTTKIPKNIRRAIFLSIDKTKITTQLFKHTATPVEFPIHPDSFLFKNDKSAFDISDAKKVLEDSGYILKDGKYRNGNEIISLNIFSNSADEYSCLMSEEISKQLNDFGIDCKNITLEENEFKYYIETKELDSFVTHKSITEGMSEIFAENNEFSFVSDIQSSFITTDDERIKQTIKLSDIISQDPPLVSICFRKGAISLSAHSQYNVIPKYDGVYNGFLN